MKAVLHFKLIKIHLPLIHFTAASALKTHIIFAPQYFSGKDHRIRW